jgi:PAS domain S-box-containing protein
MPDSVLPITSPEWRAALFDEFPLPLAVVAGTHRFLACNDAYCRLLGYARSELVGTRWQDHTHPGDVAGDEQGAESLSHHGAAAAYSLDKRYIAKDGGDVWVTLHVRSIFADGALSCYYVLAIPHEFGRDQTANEGQSRIWRWARRHPKDALLIGGVLSYFIGVDRVLALIQELLKP